MKRVAAALTIVIAMILAVPASAQTTPTLSADATKIDFGDGVTLSGTAPGTVAGTTIEIRNGAGASIASATVSTVGTTMTSAPASSACWISRSSA